MRFRSPPPRGLLLLAVSLALLLSGPVSADEDPLQVGVTNKLDYRRLDQNRTKEEAFRNRMELTAIRGPFSAWMRLESLQISNANVYDPFGAVDVAPGVDLRIDETEITKRALTIEADRFRGTVGDVSFVFGRGLMPTVFEDEELNFDTRLEGIVGHYDDDRGTVSLLAGSHDGNRFRGVYVEPVPWRFVRVGGGFVEAWGSGQDTEIRDREQHVGGLAELTLGPASLYGEYVQREFAGIDVTGHGGFVSGLVSLGGFTVSAEWKDFLKFEHEFHDPPTTLRQHTWTMLNRENGQILSDIPDDDVNGFLVDAEYAAGLFTTFLGSYSRLEKDDSGDTFWEAYGEAKGTWRERVFGTAGGAESEFAFGNIFEERLSGFGEVIVELDDANSLTLGAEWAEVQESNTATQAFEFPEEFRERIFYLSWGRSPWLNLTVSYEDTGDPSESRDDWTTVVAEIAVADGHDVLLSYGSERGGWKCTGGVCFFEPEFEGLKLRWVARF